MAHMILYGSQNITETCSAITINLMYSYFIFTQTTIYVLSASHTFSLSCNQPLVCMEEVTVIHVKIMTVSYRKIIM